MVQGKRWRGHLLSNRFTSTRHCICFRLDCLCLAWWKTCPGLCAPTARYCMEERQNERACAHEGEAERRTETDHKGGRGAHSHILCLSLSVSVSVSFFLSLSLSVSLSLCLSVSVSVSLFLSVSGPARGPRPRTRPPCLRRRPVGGARWRQQLVCRSSAQCPSTRASRPPSAP